MTDTPAYIQQAYAEFIMSKSVIERFRMASEMSNDGRRMVECSIATQHPDWSPGQLKAAVFERIYRNDFSAEEMERIKAALIAFHQQHQP